VRLEKNILCILQNAKVVSQAMRASIIAITCVPISLLLEVLPLRAKAAESKDDEILSKCAQAIVNKFNKDLSTQEHNIECSKEKLNTHNDVAHLLIGKLAKSQDENSNGQGEGLEFWQRVDDCKSVPANLAKLAQEESQQDRVESKVGQNLRTLNEHIYCFFCMDTEDKRNRYQQRDMSCPKIQRHTFL